MSEQQSSLHDDGGHGDQGEMEAQQQDAIGEEMKMASDDHESLLGDADPEVTDFVQTNPIMDRVRLTLREQLLQTRDRVRLELKEQEDELKKAKREREDAGIELYGVQQQLARLQSNLKSIDKRYDEVSKERIEGQAKVAAAKKRYAERLNEAEKLGKEETKAQEELDTMLEKVRQAKKYNEAMKSEVAVTRTVANKTEEDLKAKAKDKLTQDNYIDSLNSQVTRLEDEIALTEAQLKAQKEQSAESDKMIRETSDALEKLASEQRRLVQQWNSSVVALGRRDQALSAATNALKKVQDSIKDLESENARFRRDIEVLEEDNENLRTIGTRLDNEIIFTESNIAKVHSNLGTLSEKFELLQESLKNTIQDEQEVDADIKKIESEMVSVSQKCELLIRERQGIEEKLATAMHERTSMSKAAQNLAKEEKLMLTKIHDKEIENASIMNEIARLDLDRLNTQAHNVQLQAKLDEELEVLKATEARIDALESEIKRCNDEIEMKTKRVSKLNREYNKMVDAYEGEEPTGPLEATIKSLSNEIEQEGSDIRSLQKEWLMRQTELIKVISKTNAIQEEDSKSTSRLSILRQKALRLVQNIHTNESALKSIEFNTRGLHTDITRLNDLIEQNTRHRMDLANRMAVHSMEF
jgi:chromosome segregation ATPase